jgi:hypothetical protein
MLKFIKTLIFTLFLGSLYAQATYSGADAVKATLIKVFEAVKQSSVYRHQVNWDELETNVLKESSSSLGFKDFKRRVKLLFSSIGDKHAALFINGKSIRAIDTPMVVLRSALVGQLKRTHPELHTQTLENKYGYILVPSNSTKDNLQKLAQAIQDSLCKLMSERPDGIIIDLRVNEGGSIYPLFTGLHQLIGDGVFGAFTNFDGTSKTNWKLKKGKFYQREKIVASVKPNCSGSKKIKVAVLLSQITASAGEMLAIALKGRKNTIFIGEKTYGLTTGNVTFRIDGYLLALSASFTEDRTGKIYRSSVIPDIEMIEGDNFSDISKDKKVLEAIKWFNSANR